MELRGGELRLNIPQPTPAGSSILLSVAADDLRVVRRLGSAKIVSAKTCRFGGGACGQAIEALRGAFYAYVNITNNGSDDAEFQVPVLLQHKQCHLLSSPRRTMCFYHPASDCRCP